jgi:phage shock protein C
MLHSTTEYPPAGRQPATRLRRCASDCVLFGVCSGIAEYLSIDPSLVRIAFVVAALWGGIGVLAYIVLAIVLPVSQEPPVPVSFSGERTRAAAGLVLVVLGGLLLAANMGWAPWLSWSLFWPGILIVFGLTLLLRNPRGNGGG